MTHTELTIRIIVVDTKEEQSCHGECNSMILSEKDGWLPWDATKTIKNEILKTKKNTQSIDC